MDIKNIKIYTLSCLDRLVRRSFGNRYRDRSFFRGISDLGREKRSASKRGSILKRNACRAYIYLVNS